MKKSWRFLSIVTLLITIMVGSVGVMGVSAQSVCSPATPISGPFTKDGLGTFCWYTTSLCDHINSWNMSPGLFINGTNYSNVFALGSSIPPLNGGYTITYNSTVTPFSHFEIGGPCPGGGPTSTPTKTFTPAWPTATFTRTAIYGASLTPTRTRTATNGPSLTPSRTATRTLTPTASKTSEPYWINVALASNFPNTVYIGGNNIMATVSTNITNAMFSIVVIDTATGLEQSQTSPIMSPAHPASQPANQALGNLANFSLDGVRPGTVFFRASVTGTEGTLTKDSAIITVVSGPTPTRTMTPTRTLTPVPNSACSPVNATIASPFVQDGIGTFCWRASSIASFITSNNTSSVNVNGINFTNMWVAVGSLPAKIDGYWYITYVGQFNWSHFEAK